MTRERKAEIRREAYSYAARELNAVLDWEKAEELFPDADERAEFDAQVARIVRSLQAKGR